MSKSDKCTKPMFDKIAAIFSRKLRLVFVPKCVLCKEVLIYQGELCPECLGFWEGSKRKRCPVCNRAAKNCSCLPLFLSNTDLIGERSLLSLSFFASPDRVTSEDTAVRRLIYAEKSRHTTAISCFAARELAAGIIKLFAETGENMENYRITFPPRSASKKMRYGFDQGKTLAKYVSKYTGIKYEECFSRSRRSDLQKTLGMSEREANAHMSFRMRKNAECKGKNYLIIDDVITTGATVNACSVMLHENGAAKVFPVSLSRTIPHTNETGRKMSDSPWFMS